MPDNERRFWPRPESHEHILGEVKRVPIDGLTIRVLMLYEEAMERNQEPAEQPKFRCRIIGDTDEIICSICDRPAAEWRLGQDAIDAIIERSQKAKAVASAGLITKEEARRME